MLDLFVRYDPSFPTPHCNIKSSHRARNLEKREINIELVAHLELSKKLALVCARPYNCT